jgi:hypothetical protein
VDWVLVVEDLPSEAVLRRIISEYAADWRVVLVDNCGGATRMKANVLRYRNASHVVPHLLLTDLDAYPCAPGLLKEWGALSQTPRLLSNVAVREVESWILADRSGVASWLQVPTTRVPQAPEAVGDPKEQLLSLGRRSRSHRLRQEFCPMPGSSASQGPLYNELVCGFIRDQWNIEAARAVSPSLDRACARIRALA